MESPRRPLLPVARHTFADDCSIGREGSPTLATSFNYWMKMMTDCCCLYATFDAILDFQESPGEEPLPAKTVRPEGSDNRHGSNSPPFIVFHDNQVGNVFACPAPQRRR